MAEYSEGTSIIGIQTIIYRKNISDVAYVRILGLSPEIRERTGYIQLAASFGEETDKRHYAICGLWLYGNAVAIYPPYESRVANGNYSLFAYWRRAGLSWNCNTY